MRHTYLKIRKIEKCSRFYQGSTNAGTIAAEIAMSVRYSGCDHGWSDSQPPTNLKAVKKWQRSKVSQNHLPIVLLMPPAEMRNTASPEETPAILMLDTEK